MGTCCLKAELCADYIYLLLLLLLVTTFHNNHPSMGDVVNVDDSAAAPDHDISALLKADFVELRKLCSDSVKGFAEQGGKPFEVWTSQMVSKNQKVTKLFLFESLQKLIKHCTRMCDRDSKTPSYDVSATHNDTSIKAMSDQFVKYIKHAEDSLAIHTTQLSDISTQLCTLQTCVDNVRTSSDSHSKLHTKSDKDQTSNVTGVQSTVSVTNVTTPSDMKCFETHDPKFIDSPLYDELSEFLANETFVAENGHSVLAFGERYRYSGGRAPDHKPIPAVITKVVDQINSKFGCMPNSVLINKYDGVDSYLPQHSDDESSIDPESSIYTLSLGETREVVFTDKYSKVETTLAVEDNSLYTMTRHSQNCFTHQINKDSVGGVRYSLTFRTVGNIFRRSTIIIGDSNSKHLAFGEGKGTFGKGLPGKRVKASEVRHISPLDCMSYANVVVVCGVNDLREGSVGRHSSTNIDVDRSFNELKDKIDTICRLKKNINVLISPILPTRSSVLNARAVRFNHLIFSQIIDQNYYRCSILNVTSLCDSTYRTNLLDTVYSRGDMVHLNHRGTRRLATIIKDAIFLRYNSGKGGRVDSRKPYSAALQDGPPGTTS